MSTGGFVPKRLAVGQKGAGRYTYKSNGESDLELDPEGSPQQPLPSFMDEVLRKSSLDSISSIKEFTAVIAEDPTVLSWRRAMHAYSTLNREAFSDALANAKVKRLDKKCEALLNQRLAETATCPRDVGGIQVRLVTSQGDQTVTVEARRGKAVDMTSLLFQAEAQMLKSGDITRFPLGKRGLRQTLKLTMDRSKRIRKLTKALTVSATERGASCSLERIYDPETGRADFNYVELTMLPTLEEKFVKEEGGPAALAEGWL